MFCKQVSQINRLHLLLSRFQHLLYGYYLRGKYLYVLTYKRNITDIVSSYDYFVNQMVTPWFPPWTVMSRHRYISFTTKCRHYNTYCKKHKQHLEHNYLKHRLWYFLNYVFIILFYFLALLSIKWTVMSQTRMLVALLRKWILLPAKDSL